MANRIFAGITSFFGVGSVRPKPPSHSLKPVWDKNVPSEPLRLQWSLLPEEETAQESEKKLPLQTGWNHKNGPNWSLLSEDETVPEDRKKQQLPLPSDWNLGNGVSWVLLPDEESSSEVDAHIVLSAGWENPFSDDVTHVSQVRTNFLKAFKRAVDFKREAEADKNNVNWDLCPKIGDRLLESLQRLQEDDPQGYQALYARVGNRAMIFHRQDSFLWSIDYFKLFLRAKDDKDLLAKIERVINFESIPK